MMKEFHKKGFPVIKMNEESFEVKAVDFSKFRVFMYSEVESVKYTRSEGDLWFWPILELISSKIDPYKFIVKKNNGGSWDYISPSKFDQDFDAIVSDIRSRINNIRK